MMVYQKVLRQGLYVHTAMAATGGTECSNGLVVSYRRSTIATSDNCSGLCRRWKFSDWDP